MPMPRTPAPVALSIAIDVLFSTASTGTGIRLETGKMIGSPATTLDCRLSKQDTQTQSQYNHNHYDETDYE